MDPGIAVILMRAGIDLAIEVGPEVVEGNRIHGSSFRRARHPTVQVFSHSEISCDHCPFLLLLLFTEVAKRVAVVVS